MPSEDEYVSADPWSLRCSARSRSRARRQRQRRSNRHPNWTWGVAVRAAERLFGHGVVRGQHSAPGCARERAGSRHRFQARARREGRGGAHRGDPRGRAANTSPSSAMRSGSRTASSVSAAGVSSCEQRTAAAPRGLPLEPGEPGRRLFDARHAEVDVQRKLLAFERELAKRQAQLAYRPILDGRNAMKPTRIVGAMAAAALLRRRRRFWLGRSVTGHDATSRAPRRRAGCAARTRARSSTGTTRWCRASASTSRASRRTWTCARAGLRRQRRAGRRAGQPVAAAKPRHPQRDGAAGDRDVVVRRRRRRPVRRAPQRRGPDARRRLRRAARGARADGARAQGTDAGHGVRARLARAAERAPRAEDGAGVPADSSPPRATACARSRFRKSWCSAATKRQRAGALHARIAGRRRRRRARRARRGRVTSRDDALPHRRPRDGLGGRRDSGSAGGAARARAEGQGERCRPIRRRRSKAS